MFSLSISSRITSEIDTHQEAQDRSDIVSLPASCLQATGVQKASSTETRIVAGTDCSLWKMA